MFILIVPAWRTTIHKLLGNALCQKVPRDVCDTCHPWDHRSKTYQNGKTFWKDLYGFKNFRRMIPLFAVVNEKKRPDLQERLLGIAEKYGFHRVVVARMGLETSLPEQPRDKPLNLLDLRLGDWDRFVVALRLLPLGLGELSESEDAPKRAHCKCIADGIWGKPLHKYIIPSQVIESFKFH